jgi:hypothetical protein
METGDNVQVCRQRLGNSLLRELSAWRKTDSRAAQAWNRLPGGRRERKMPSAARTEGRRLQSGNPG